MFFSLLLTYLLEYEQQQQWADRTFVRAKVTDIVNSGRYEKVYRVDKDDEDHYMNRLRRAYEVNERVEYRVGAHWFDAKVLSISSPGVYVCVFENIVFITFEFERGV